jgi:hypothetical protein
MQSLAIVAARIAGQIYGGRWIVEAATPTPTLEKRTPGLAGRVGVREDNRGHSTG